MHKDKGVTHMDAYERGTSIHRRWRLLIALAVACGIPVLSSAQGCTTYPGVVTQVATYAGVSTGVLQYFVVTNSSSSQAFWIQDATSEGPARVANILAAAASGQAVGIFNCAQTFSFGGETGYLSLIEIVNYSH